MKTRKYAIRLILAFYLCLSLAACGSSISTENFSKIKEGMTMEQVADILGEPSETSSISLGGVSGTAAVWKDGNASISIKFLNGVVKMKSMEK